MIKHFKMYLIILFTMPSLALADTTTPSSSATTRPTTSVVQTTATHPASAAPAKKPSDLKISGYIEPSYNYLFHSNHFTSGSQDRDFDLQQDGFTLQQAAITLAYQPTDG